MKRKILVNLLILVLLVCAIPNTVMAELVAPTTLGAPEHFGVSHYYGDALYFTVSAPEDMRDYIKKRAEENPENWQSFSPHFQIDYKIDNGSWHYSSDWDSLKTVKNNTLYTTFVNDKKYMSSERESMTTLFPDDPELKLLKNSDWNYFKDHTITFRTRFVESFDNGNTYICSDWSKEYKLSANVKADYNMLINHAPTLTSVGVKSRNGGEPYFEIKTGKIPGDVQELHTMSGSTVRTEIWMRRVGDKDFKLIQYEWASYEHLEIDASDYFDSGKQSYDAESYEIKVRYALDLRNYKQSGYDSSSTSVDIYSPFSNVISHNMPAWSNASQWATEELKKADDMGLIPSILQGQDLTKKITREEFAEVALLMYEKASGITNTTPYSPNPFKDTTNSQILKAFKLGIVKGISVTEFKPSQLINREQVAAMLVRTIKLIAPDSDYSTTGAPEFSDIKEISGWALNDCLYMAKLGIIKGTNGNFMPKATTQAQIAAGYANTSREQALAMSVRSVEKIDEIKNSSPSAPAATPPPTTPPTTPTPSGSVDIVGAWSYHIPTGSMYDVHITYVFNGDGTYYHLARSTYDYSCNAYHGNYKIDNNKILFTNRTKILFYYDKPGYLELIAEAEKAGFKPTDNDEKALKLVDAKHIQIGDSEYERVE